MGFDTIVDDIQTTGGFAVGVDFLKHGEEYLDVDEDLIKLAKLECELIHVNTQTKEKADYPKKPGPLCKWSTGQCNFYGKCFGTQKWKY